MSRRLRIAVRRFGPFIDALREQAAAFCRTQLETIDFDLIEYDLVPLHRLLIAERGLASGEWDLAFLPTDWLAEAMEQELLSDLSARVAANPPEDYPRGWPKSLLSVQQLNGAIYGIPYHNGPYCLIYRRDLLDLAGLSVPSSWDGYLASARRLADPVQGVSGALSALLPDGHNGFYDLCCGIWARGDEPFDEKGRPRIASDAAADTLDAICALANDQSVVFQDPVALDSVQAGLAFGEGRAAMAINWFGFAALAARDSPHLRDRIGVAPIPAGYAENPVSLNVYWLLAVATGSREPDLAWGFLRHVATAPMDRITTLAGAVGTRHSTWADPEVLDQIPFGGAMEGLHAIARTLPRTRHLPQIASCCDKAIQLALTGGRSSRAILDDIQRNLDAIT